MEGPYQQAPDTERKVLEELPNSVNLAIQRPRRSSNFSASRSVASSRRTLEERDLQDYIEEDNEIVGNEVWCLAKLRKLDKLLQENMPSGNLHLPLFYQRSQRFHTRITCIVSATFVIILASLSFQWIGSYGTIDQM